MLSILIYHAITVVVVMGFVMALSGWGAGVRHVLRIETNGIGINAALGLAAAVCIGGILNLANVISPLFVLAALAGGSIVGIANALRRAKDLQLVLLPSRDRRLDLPLLIGLGFCLLLLLRGMLSGTARHFLDTDDFQAYLVYPLKMLTLGGFGPDPFSTRRIESSLGGQTFLDALFVSIAGLERMNALEYGVGRVVITFLAWDISRYLNLSMRQCLLPMAVCVIIWPAMVNTTSVMTGIALFMLLLLALSREPTRLRTPLLALTCAGLLALVPVLNLKLESFAATEPENKG